MSLLFAKYKVKSTSQILFNKEIYDLLISKTKDYNNLPNLLIHGTNGVGKKTLINILLENIYNKKIYKIKSETYTITGYSNTNIDILINQSPFHIIIEPTNTGIDKYTIHEIVRPYAQQTIINFNKMIPSFKIILINNIDNLSYHAQSSLRYIMEKYYKNCKFILCSYQLSKIIEPIKSRCLHVAVPAPSTSDIYKILFNISCRENIYLNEHTLDKLSKKAKNNVKSALYILDLYNLKIYNYKQIWISSLDYIIDLIYEFILHPSTITFNSSHILKCRDILYNIFITNIPTTTILTELLKLFIDKINDKCDSCIISLVIQLFGFYETRITKGKRLILHLETLLNSIFYHIYVNNQILNKSLLYNE